ncbi:MAG: hypothetical protein CMM52_01255 [Rhodospirillaceae bacterium]|nr:hypothetical protein [Rhodospirillaceae bacterium]|tara:strand:+ start:54636 stop:55727 length:1092 start_codon:yes stop_codon:yes gene_type:complete
MKRHPYTSFLFAATTLLGLSLTAGISRDAHSFAYIFAGETNGVDVVTHALGYNGTGGTVTVTVGIDPTSAFAAQMVIPTQNVVNTWNGLAPTTGNLNPSGISGSQVDFESTLLHEVGHSLGIAHPNAASESGLSGSAQNYTKATDGANDVFEVNAGADGIIGSADDIRGDDVNLNYFRKSDNNPVNIPGGGLGIVDSTTYSRDIADLPVGDNYSANGDRAVAAALGFANTEAVMQQGTFFGETQRELTAEDVAGILYANSGIDEIQGTADDYNLVLKFLGLDAGADIVVDFDNSQVSFAASFSSGVFIGTDHVAITDTSIYFNSGSNWFFNQESNADIDAPDNGILFTIGLAALGYIRRRKKI